MGEIPDRKLKGQSKQADPPEVRHRLTPLLAVLVAAAWVSPAAQASAGEPVQAFAEAVPSAQARLEGRSITSIELDEGRPVVRYRHVKNPSQAAAYVQQLRTQRGVMAASVDQPVKALGLGAMAKVGAKQAGPSAAATMANDPLRNLQWGLDYMQIENVWNYSRGDGKIVAVLDSGIDGNHPDLVGQVLPGKDFIRGTDGRNDAFGHGTHVAGTIAALSNNGVGVSSVAPSAKVLPVRVLDDNGEGWEGDVANGIIWASQNGATVINLSLGGPGNTPTLEAAVQYALSRDIVLVAASGNDAATTNYVTYPCAYAQVICVGAVDTAQNVGEFSNYGAHIDIVAPGVDIPSSANGGYYWNSGTSMAAPHIAATAALLRQRFPRMTQSQLAARLYATAADRGAPGRDNYYGHGFVDALAALSRNPLPTAGRATDGYWLTAADGGVFSFGNTAFYGSTGNIRLNRPIVGMAATPSGGGYRFVASDGGVFNYGDARFFGSTGSLTLNKPIVGMAITPSGNGYWLVASDGGIFTFGDAKFLGSTGSLKLNLPVVGMAATPTGNGYWMVASDGGIFTFGDARFYGSTGSMKLNRPIVGMAPTASGNGYWMVASDGGVFTFGDAMFLGSAVGRASRVTSIAAYGDGYLMADANGKAFAFGDALGVPGAAAGPDVNIALNQPVVGGALALR